MHWSTGPASVQPQGMVTYSRELDQPGDGPPLHRWEGRMRSVFNQLIDLPGERV